MSPGPVEEVGKVASGFMAAMSTQPLALALVLCNLTLLALFFYAASLSTEKFNIIMAQQSETMKMLYNCTPARPNG